MMLFTVAERLTTPEELSWEHFDYRNPEPTARSVTSDQLQSYAWSLSTSPFTPGIQYPLSILCLFAGSYFRALIILSKGVQPCGTRGSDAEARDSATEIARCPTRGGLNQPRKHHSHRLARKYSLFYWCVALFDCGTLTPIRPFHLKAAASARLCDKAGVIQVSELTNREEDSDKARGTQWGLLGTQGR